MLKSLAIINFTPDSFSDGGQYFSEGLVVKRLDFLLSQGVNRFDFGAQSTAPMNSDIGLDEELSRLLCIFRNNAILDRLENTVVSIDTFRPEVIFEVRNLILKANPRMIIWNDVSGVIDENVFKWLEYDCVEYVFSHNLAQKRTDTCNHMDHISKDGLESFWNSFVEYFDVGMLKLKEFKKCIYLDPCFGFSKSYEQNLFLLSKFKDFQAHISLGEKFLWGVSRKSFLRKNIPKIDILDEDALRSSLLNLEIASLGLINSIDSEVLVRTHMPEFLKDNLNFLNKLNI